MAPLLEITKTIAIGKCEKTGKLVDIVFYDGKIIEWYYSLQEDRNKIEIITSQLKVEGESIIKGRLYWRNDNSRVDSSIFYLDQISILDYSLFDLLEKND